MKEITFTCVLVGLVFLLHCACQTAHPKYTGPDGYDWNNPTRSFLRENLTEISGIAFEPGSDTVLRAINDEQGKLFSILLSAPGQKMPNLKFAQPGDFEDLSWWNGAWWVLRSNGDILKLGSDENSTVVYTGLLPGGEYEAMAAEGTHLYIACKQSKESSKNGMMPVYKLALDSTGSPAVGASFALDEAAAAAMLGKKKIKLRPSAMAWHPLEKKWFILSANDRLLLTTSDSFHILGAWALPVSNFPQAEGITFAPNGDLYISNEGGETTATLLKFTYDSGVSK
jgi:hypothetical protein